MIDQVKGTRNLYGKDIDNYFLGISDQTYCSSLIEIHP